MMNCFVYFIENIFQFLFYFFFNILFLHICVSSEKGKMFTLFYQLEYRYSLFNYGYSYE